jgi:regulator of protease activity HflC (stomatin/prohibitin superfamily)
VKTSFKNALLLLITSATLIGCANVDSSENAVVSSGGKVSGCEGPGRHFHVIKDQTKYPIGIQHTDMLKSPTEGDRKEPDAVTAASVEGAQVAIDLTVNYRVINDCAKLTQLYKDGIKGEQKLKDVIIRPATRSAVRDVFGNYKVKDAISTKRGEIAAKIVDVLEKKFAKAPARGSVQVDSVELRNFYLPPELQKQVDQAISAEATNQRIEIERRRQETEAETARLVAQKGAETAKIKAEGEAQARLSAAKADAESRTIAAQAEADANSKIAASLTPELSALKIAQACSDAIAKTGASIVNCGSGSATGSNSSSGGSPTVIVDGRK